MVAETLTGTRAADSFPTFQYHASGVLQVAYGQYAIAANVEDGDIFELCKLPPGARVLGGRFRAPLLDSGTAAIDLDVGWAANGGSGTYDSADADGLGNLGVLSTATDVSLTGEFLTAGLFPEFTRETTIQVEANAAAATFAAGTISVVVYYVTD